ncbi:hypothetical protein AB0C51_23350 [Streptomyces pathocidini]|uniref:hypothetical protein n=1 Tax=Streptomyces pathocidini TaxID=1650571 RepID=UPI0033C184BD
MQRRTIRNDLAGPPLPRRAGRYVRRACVAVIAAVAAVATLILGGTTPAAAAGFQVFTNERGAHRPGLEQYGGTRATVVYDVFKFTCDAAGCYSNGGALPSQATYEAQVKTYMGSGQFGGAATAPVVLDFEDIELTRMATGAPATNAYNWWRQVLQWTRNAAPQAPICHYGYEGWSNQNHDLVKRLHDDNLLNCFAPRMYWDSGETQTSWSSELDTAISRDRAMAPTHPIYPYTHPKQINGGYVAGGTWSYMLNQLKAKTEGVVVWEPSADDSSACAWVGQHSYETGILTGTSSSGPLKAVPSAPSGSCVVPRGTTTTIPVTIQNTSSATTAATTMQSFTGEQTQGVTGTWQYWNVPSLAPGATWETALQLTVPSTQTFSTTLTHLRTGISDTRYTVIVQ